MQDTLKSLLTKLSAVRVTLSDQEQSLLDQLILGSEAEVKAQSMKVISPDQARATTADEARANAMKVVSPDQARATEADEARANAMKVVSPDQARATEADEARANAMKITAPDQARAATADEARANRLLYLKEAEYSDAEEVSAHSMPASMLPKLGIQNPVWVRIIYDPRMECYKVL
jgi:hypothetical protein